MRGGRNGVAAPVYSGTPRSNHTRAFTLFEILIAIAIAAVLMGTGLYGTRGFLEEERLRQPLRALETLAQDARARALLEGLPCLIRITGSMATLHDLPPHTAPADALALPPIREVPMPEGTALAAQPWGAPAWTDAYLWMFRPSGLSVPVRVRVTRRDSWIEGAFNPLTADLEEERFHLEP